MGRNKAPLWQQDADGAATGRKMARARGESGNVFVFVVLGIVLFAALMFVVSRGMTESPSALSDKKIRLFVSDMLDYSQKLERAVERLQQHSVSENDLSFENPVALGYTNGACADASCRVFDPVGGGISYLKPDPGWLDLSADANRDWGFANADAYQDIGTTCSADSCADLALILWPIKKEVCLALNQQLGIDNPGGQPPTDSTMGGGQFTGSFAYAQTIGDEAGGAAIKGKDTGCFTQTANGLHYFYHILIAR